MSIDNITQNRWLIVTKLVILPNMTDDIVVLLVVWGSLVVVVVANLAGGDAIVVGLFVDVLDWVVVVSVVFG